MAETPVITGWGVVSAAGRGPTALWEAVANGQSLLRPLSLFPSPRYGEMPVAQVPDELLPPTPNARSRNERLAALALEDALADAGLNACPHGTGLFLGATVGGMLGTEDMLAEQRDGRSVTWGALRRHPVGDAAFRAARRWKLDGPITGFSTACSAGAMAIGLAARLIARGEADCMLAGGVDSLCRLTVNGFGSLMLLDENGSRPFDENRQGISLGEAAAFLVIESAESARRRGAAVLAAIAGWGWSADAHHATAPHPDGDGAVAAMTRALATAGLSPEAIGYLNAHGTGTPDNDRMETRAIERVFGSAPPPFSSTKGCHGHTLAASGALEAIICGLALRHQCLPPSANLRAADPDLPLTPLSEARASRFEAALSNSFGFGGNNVSLVFTREPRPLSLPVPRANDIAITGAGVASAFGCTPEAFFANAFTPPPAQTRALPPALGGRRVPVWPCPEESVADGIPPRQRRRLTRLQLMTLHAAGQASPEESRAGLDPARVAVAVGTAWGSADETARFVENMIAQHEAAPMPQAFTNSVHNALASRVSMALPARGLNAAPTSGDLSFAHALLAARGELEDGAADLVFAGAADELNDYALALPARFRPDQSPPFTESAALFALQRKADSRNALAALRALKIARRAPSETNEDIAAWATRHAGTDIDCWLVNARAAASLPTSARTLRYDLALGDSPNAPALAFLLALGLLGGQIPAPDGASAPKCVALFTESPTGDRALCVLER